MSNIKLTGIVKDYILYEGLIHSTQIDTAVDYINKWMNYKRTKMWAKPSKDSSKISITIYKNLEKNDMDNFQIFVNNLGWYISSYLINKSPFRHKKFVDSTFNSDIKTSSLLSLTLEAKFDKEISKYDIKELYHASPIKFKGKIEKIGLIPKSLSKIAYHPERIYLSTDLKNTNSIINLFNERGEYIVYEINIKELTDYNSSIRFFTDPNMINAIYTLSNVPPKFLKIKEVIDKGKL